MLSTQAGMRQLATLGGGGIILHGTYHRTSSLSTTGTGAASQTLGMMFTNALSSPRSLVGDSGAYWADSFAALGYPCFRFDLPGLGDSYGEIPNELLRFTNDGGYAGVASSKARELVESYGLSGVVVFGHCAGATTAIYAASTLPECKGLVLLDPYFNLPKALTVTLRPGLVLWARRTRIGAILRGTYDQVREVPYALRRGALPANANLCLIKRLKEVISRGTPVLIVKGHEASLGGGTGKGGAFDYFGYIRSFAVRSNQSSIKTIDDTDHSFSNHAGQLAVRQYTETWLNEHFPLAVAPAESRPPHQSEGQLTPDIASLANFSSGG